MRVTKRSQEVSRSYLPIEFTVDSWEKLAPFFEELHTRLIDSASSLEQWIINRNELNCALWEEYGQQYIEVTSHAENKAVSAAYSQFMKNIWVNMQQWENKLDRKLNSSEYLMALPEEKYGVYVRAVRHKKRLQCDKNILLQSQLTDISKRYDEITSAMVIDFEGEELTFSGVLAKMEHNNSVIRKEVLQKWMSRFLEGVPTLQELFSEMVKIRHQVALNAGFDNYRDYKFVDLERFDYTADDCFKFHDSIQQEIMPIIEGFDKELADSLKLSHLSQWDTLATPEDKTPLNPFQNVTELIEKAISVLTAVKPSFGDVFRQMDAAGHFNLDSRKGKANGAYCMSLFETNLPFIFMNETGTQENVRVLLHEGGHAIHDILARHHGLTHSRYAPSEISEFAAMSMELLTMEHWNIYYPIENDLKRAKTQHLQRCLMGLRRVASYDKFQHWIYEHPNHSIEERTVAWKKINMEFTSSSEDGTGAESYVEARWLLVSHIFKTPFYIIEYGFARLGSLAIWRNYKQDPEKTIKEYEYALSLGYTKPIPKLYEAAGIKFDFSAEYIAELAAFVKMELEMLTNDD